MSLRSVLSRVSRFVAKSGVRMVKYGLDTSPSLVWLVVDSSCPVVSPGQVLLSLVMFRYVAMSRYDMFSFVAKYGCVMY